MSSEIRGLTHAVAMWLWGCLPLLLLLLYNCDAHSNAVSVAAVLIGRCLSSSPMSCQGGGLADAPARREFHASTSNSTLPFDNDTVQKQLRLFWEMATPYFKVRWKADLMDACSRCQASAWALRAGSQLSVIWVDSGVPP